MPITLNLSASLLLLNILLRMPFIRLFRPPAKWLMLFLFLALIQIPITHISLVGIVSGILGNISITTTILLCLWLLSLFTAKPLLLLQPIQQQLFPLVFFAGILLYFFALGIVLFDLYALGYQAFYILLALLFVCCFNLWRKNFTVIFIILIDLLVYSASLLNSSNLWDYLIDPLVFCLALYTYFCIVLKKSVTATR